MYIAYVASVTHVASVDAVFASYRSFDHNNSPHMGPVGSNACNRSFVVGSDEHIGSSCPHCSSSFGEFSMEGHALAS